MTSREAGLEDLRAWPRGLATDDDDRAVCRYRPRVCERLRERARVGGRSGTRVDTEDRRERGARGVRTPDQVERSAERDQGGMRDGVRKGADPPHVAARGVEVEDR